MKKGFIFNDLLCVNCKACSAACILENGWTTRPREIFIFNRDVLPHLPVINLSLACNHCDKPVCLEGCPSGAYFREPGSGAVVADPKKCLGCSYCTWNCPYDAPKIAAGGTIEKCNLCYTRIEEGLEPACSSSCPTGALGYGPVQSNVGMPAVIPDWFPDKGLDPAIFFIAGKREKLMIAPMGLFGDEPPETERKPNPVISSWSLSSFSFLTTVAVALVSSSLTGGKLSDIRLLVILLSGAAVSSLFHLRIKSGAWRAAFNFRRSPLSREIVFFLIFSGLSVISILSGSPGLSIAASLAGLALLIAIDSVYLFSDDSVKTRLHPGQTFLSGLMLTSVLSGALIPLLFVSAVKTALSVRNIAYEARGSLTFTVKFFRIALLLISIAGLVTVLDPKGITILLLFLAGEFIDRLLFYCDFLPMNIKTTIEMNKNTGRDEKKNC